MHDSFHNGIVVQYLVSSQPQPLLSKDGMKLLLSLLDEEVLEPIHKLANISDNDSRVLFFPGDQRSQELFDRATSECSCISGKAEEKTVLFVQGSVSTHKTGLAQILGPDQL